MFQTKVVEKIRTQFNLQLIFTTFVQFMRLCGKIMSNEAGHTWQEGSCALQDTYPRLQIHTRNM